MFMKQNDYDLHFFAILLQCHCKEREISSISILNKQIKNINNFLSPNFEK